MSVPGFQVGQSVFVGRDGGELPRGTEVHIEKVSRRHRPDGWRYGVVPTRHIGAGGRLWIDEEVLSSQDTSLTIDQRTDDGEHVIGATGDLSLTTAPQLRSAFQSVVATEPTARIVLDLRGLEYIDSAGLGLLIDVTRALKPPGCLQVMVAPRSQPDQVIKLMQLRKIINITQSSKGTDKR